LRGERGSLKRARGEEKVAGVILGRMLNDFQAEKRGEEKKTNIKSDKMFPFFPC